MRIDELEDRDLRDFDLPGRTLRFTGERAVALARGSRTDLDDRPEEVRLAGPAPPPGAAVRPLAAMECDDIVAALERPGGHQGRTAEQLGFGSAILHRKLRDWGLTRPHRPPRA